MPKHVITIFAAVLVFAALTASAQTVVEVTPPFPTTGDPVSLRFFNPNIHEIESVTRTGNHFRFDFSQCRITCISQPIVPLGTLPAGTYTYAIFIEGRPEGTGSFAVIPHPDVPALSPAAMLALCAMLLGAGWIAIART